MGPRTPKPGPGWGHGARGGPLSQAHWGGSVGTPTRWDACGRAAVRAGRGPVKEQTGLEERLRRQRLAEAAHRPPVSGRRSRSGLSIRSEPLSPAFAGGSGRGLSSRERCGSGSPASSWTPGISSLLGNVSRNGTCYTGTWGGEKQARTTCSSPPARWAPGAAGCPGSRARSGVRAASLDPQGQESGPLAGLSGLEPSGPMPCVVRDRRLGVSRHSARCHCGPRELPPAVLIADALPPCLPAAPPGASSASLGSPTSPDPPAPTSLRWHPGPHGPSLL